MNVIITNERNDELSNIDIDVIKTMTGSFDVNELAEMFKNFFFNKMILDVTALKDYTELSTYENLIKYIEADRIIFLLPSESNLCTPNFLGHLVSMGIYNFTTDLNGIKFLLKKPNTLQDVEHIQKMSANTLQGIVESNGINNSVNPDNSNPVKNEVVNATAKVQTGVTIIGVKNVTEHAGATTFVYILKKELENFFGKESVVAIELNRNDFMWFNEKNMISCKDVEIHNTLSNLPNATIVLVDLNNCSDDSFCGDVLYLVEPSTIKLNKLVRRNGDAFKMIANKKVLLNKSLLLQNDVSDFQGEAGIKVFYNMPPLDERKKNAIVNDFLIQLGLLNRGGGNNDSGRIFGLFRR